MKAKVICEVVFEFEQNVRSHEEAIEKNLQLETITENLEETVNYDFSFPFDCKVYVNEKYISYFKEEERKTPKIKFGTVSGAKIREKIISSGLKIWQVADKYGCNDGNFSRKLRKEFSADEAEKILKIINELKNE